ncbi:uncharacterized protein [Manis javanica]|uniref:uncharacterized protein isoform X5 n=1 Tax=Manis javanica TaxID=9974 RepID=UPI003C6DAEE7
MDLKEIIKNLLGTSDRNSSQIETQRAAGRGSCPPQMAGMSVSQAIRVSELPILQSTTQAFMTSGQLVSLIKDLSFKVEKNLA